MAAPDTRFLDTEEVDAALDRIGGDDSWREASDYDLRRLADEDEDW